MIGNKKIKHIVIKTMLIKKIYTNIIEHQSIRDDQKQFFSKNTYNGQGAKESYQE